jgi:hypothetical protein
MPDEFEGMAAAFIRRGQEAQAAADRIAQTVDSLPMEQCEAEGHSYNVVSEFETYEPISLNCYTCGAIWSVGPKSTRNEGDMLHG